MHKAAVVILTGTTYFGTLIGVAAQEAGGSLPAGEGKALVESSCATCHELGKITHTRQTKIGWQQTIQDMIARGAQVSDDDAPVIATYLATNFGQLNINTASRSQLEDFLGFSEKESQALIAYREANGKIKNFEQLAAVPGLDLAKVKAKHDLIAFVQ
jgi:competence ComEA-like helix-hairpin-helix protein